MSNASKRVRAIAVHLFGPDVGCSDGSCVFGHPGGMCTNGGCHCLMNSPFETRNRGMMLSRIAHALADQGSNDQGV